MENKNMTEYKYNIISATLDTYPVLLKELEVPGFNLLLPLFKFEHRDGYLTWDTESNELFLIKDDGDAIDIESTNVNEHQLSDMFLAIMVTLNFQIFKRLMIRHANDNAN